MSLLSTGRRAVIAAAASAGLLSTVPALAASPVSAVPAQSSFCGLTWGSLPKSPFSTMPFEGSSLPSVVRAGRHECFDRVVIEHSGGLRLFASVGYTPMPVSDVYGNPLPLAGGAALVATGYGAYTASDFTATYPGFATLRQVTSGGVMRSMDNLYIGVRARLPFRVFALAGPGTHNRLVIDIAHRW